MQKVEQPKTWWQQNKWWLAGTVAGSTILVLSMLGQAGLGTLEIDELIMTWGGGIEARGIADAGVFVSSVLGKFFLLAAYGLKFYQDPKGYYDEFENKKLFWLYCCIGLFVPGPVFAGIARFSVRDVSAPLQKGVDVAGLFVNLYKFSSNSSFIESLETPLKSGQFSTTGLTYFPSYIANIISATALVPFPFLLAFPFLRHNLSAICWHVLNRFSCATNLRDKLTRPSAIRYPVFKQEQRVSSYSMTAAVVALAIIGVNIYGFWNFYELGPKIAAANAEYLGAPVLKNCGGFWGYSGFIYLMWMSVGIVPGLCKDVADFFESRRKISTGPDAGPLLRSNPNESPPEWKMWALGFAIFIAILGAAPNAEQAHLAGQSPFMQAVSAFSSFSLEVGTLYFYFSQCACYAKPVEMRTGETPAP